MRSVVSLFLIAGAAFAQSAAPKFTVADVHGSGHSSLFGNTMRGPFFGAGRYEVHGASMVDLIHVAYGVDQERVFGGPGWLEFDHFDVVAMAPAGSTAESRKQMLQSLLADRFGLKVHIDSRPTPAYALTAGASSKLQESNASAGGCEFKIDRMPAAQQRQEQPPAPGEPRTAQPPQQLPILIYTCKGVTMSAFASSLAGAPAASEYFDNKPLVDSTELTGSYDITIRYTPKTPPGFATTGENFPLLEALDKQLGLKAVLSTIPMPAVVVDSANEKPTDNPADVAKSFPPMPTEFEVAEIKPSPPPSMGAGPNMPEIKNGRFILPGITLQNLMTVAFDMNPNEEIVGAPKWFNTARFDIIAKAPEGMALGDMTPTQGRTINVNIDGLQPMIRNLIVDQFKLKVHTEDRQKSVYALVAVKPKLTKADPNGRTKWTEGPGPDGKDPRKTNPVLGRLVTCTNMSIAQFAKLLPEIASGYVHDDVIDATGLEGNWDFTLSFSGAGRLQVGPGTGDAAPDPSGALSLLDAMQKQLGLKLEMQKRAVPTLVIDHVDEKPSGN